MSDSTDQGDAARLESALERIVQALVRPPGEPPPQPGVAEQVRESGVDIAQLGARLDGLIAELRDVLGTTPADPPPASPAQP